MNRSALSDMLRAVATGNNMSMHELAGLANELADNADIPTVAEFRERVEEVDGNKAGWVSREGQFNLLVAELGHLRLDQVKAGDIERVAVAKRNAVVAAEDDRQDKLAADGLEGAPRRHGRGAERNFIEAARRYFTIAKQDRLIGMSPAHEVALPRRGAPTARSIPPDRLEAFWSVIVSGGDDPQLDGTLAWFHLETSARRGGAIDLRIRDLKRERCIIVLNEKGRNGKIERHQPVSRELIETLLELARQRGATKPGDFVFQYKEATAERPHPLTRRRYQTLYRRIRKELPWARDVWVKLHDLRRTGITMIERISGSPAIARLYAGHSTGTPLDTYDAASEEELRAAMAEYLGRPVGEDAATE